MGTFNGKFKGNIRIGDSYAPSGDFPVVSAEHVYVPNNIKNGDETIYQGESLDARLEELESKISDGGGVSSVTVDEALDPESANPIANSAVCAALDKKSDVHSHPYASSGHDHDDDYAPYMPIEINFPSSVSANTRYFVCEEVKSGTLRFPSNSARGDEIYIQFGTGSEAPNIKVDNALISQSTFPANSIIEIHAIYGVTTPSTGGGYYSGWIALVSSIERS